MGGAFALLARPTQDNLREDRGLTLGSRLRTQCLAGNPSMTIRVQFRVLSQFVRESSPELLIRSQPLPDTQLSQASRLRQPTVLAISSGGGHWVQLLRLRPAFEGCKVVFATVRAGYRADVGDAPFRVVPDANRWSKCGLMRTALGVGCLLLRERPDIIISTGAAPGYFAIAIGSTFGARTVWIDSVANAEALSLSGQKAGRFAHLWLTQWPHLAKENGPRYMGNVL